MARTLSQPVPDSHGNRVKNLSYRETANGRVYESNVYVDGRSRRIRLAANNHKQAIDEHKTLQLSEQVRKAKRGSQPLRRLTLAEAAERYFAFTGKMIARCEAEGWPASYKGVKSLDTLDTYRTNWRKWIEPFFKGKTLCIDITTPRCQDFLAFLREQPGRTGDTLAEGTVNSIKSALSEILDEARAAGGLDSDPLAGIPKRDKPSTTPRDSYRKIAVRPEVLFAIYDNAPPDYRRALVALAVFAGMRSSEIVSLKWEDVYFDAEKPYIWIAHGLTRGRERKKTKTGKERPFPLNVEMTEALQAHRENERERGLGAASDYVFTHPRRSEFYGQPMRGRAVLNAVVKACENLPLADGRGEPIAKIDVRAARRSIATLLANNPDIPRHVSAGQMGHSVETADREYVQKHHDAQEIEMVGLAIQRPTLTVIEGGKEEIA